TTTAAPRLVLVGRLLVNLMVFASWGKRFVVSNCLVMRLTAKLLRAARTGRRMVRASGRMLACSLRNLTELVWFGSPRTVHHCHLPRLIRRLNALVLVNLTYRTVLSVQVDSSHSGRVLQHKHHHPNSQQGERSSRHWDRRRVESILPTTGKV